MAIKDEKELLDIYRRLPVEKQKELKNFIKAKVRELEKEEAKV